MTITTTSFGYSQITQILTYILVSIGYLGIFKKCGVRRIWAFVPGVRQYKIGLCGNKEEDGRHYAIIYFILYILTFAVYLDINTGVKMLLFVPIMGLGVASIVYEARIYLGLINVFGRKKRWIWLFLFFEWFVSIVWGYSKKFQPTMQVKDFSKIEGAKEFGGHLSAIEEGLTVNIKNRTVIDFFRKKDLLKDIHMRIPTGHMVLLLGGSGAGKTTYLNAVTGYEKANASIKLGKEDVYGDYGKMKYDIGFVPQQDLMRGNDTVLMTLLDAATLRLPSSVSASKRNKRVEEVLQQFGLTSVKNNLVEKLSGGQRKRLSIAMEFISDPTLFILDEPDSGLDGVVARSLFEKLRAIADEGKIVVVITHTPDRVIDLFDDVIVLAKDKSRTGRLAWYGPVKEAYEFFGKDSMEDILLSINQKDEGGEGRADEFVEKYADMVQEKVV
ncbi:ABC-type multidrug transport system, ATPase component [Butyrivibrio fibrisolvens DSM 3071]|uniref:ABC-type multidrug transport system, ATPase component n=1 Tax=Butyrivibrio fibrisolvens DSM 3071 TaxID=1121131 RepID=A0A1M5ZM95_BUTFI|nr:ABC transporter ATP-binding protein [Butyrivibrio fibrisolvens]SHI25301.1 ABC-type multidrug transport system, ATPase component [Butyrivibrio fibrisolvens DSM 3071]